MTPKMDNRLKYRFYVAAMPLLTNNSVISMDSFVQHGKTTCLQHSISVAYYSLATVNKLGIKCSESCLVRGALLHDYFLYDWHVRDKSHGMHGFKHSVIALHNAERDFELNETEKDIIKRHMFPLVPIPPKSAEGAVVCVVDKLCSINEIFRRTPYSKTPLNIYQMAIRSENQ
jgi:Predicted HD superfamily hydrolase